MPQEGGIGFPALKDARISFFPVNFVGQSGIFYYFLIPERFFYPGNQLIFILYSCFKYVLSGNGAERGKFLNLFIDKTKILKYEYTQNKETPEPGT